MAPCHAREACGGQGAQGSVRGGRSEGTCSGLLLRHHRHGDGQPPAYTSHGQCSCATAECAAPGHDTGGKDHHAMLGQGWQS
eukprot:10928138-Alexandrium_andersonii.AAC.1